MRVILVMVQSINGKITRGDDPNIYSWTSKEDADFFFSLLQKNKLIVMGSGTYEAARGKIQPKEGQLRIVLTRSPKKYKNEEVPGKLEFQNISPKTLVSHMSAQGYDSLLLVGGGEMNKAFFEDKLVDEIYLTIEPKIFGTGKTTVADGNYFFNTSLVSVKKLNAQGSLLLHYKRVVDA